MRCPVCIIAPELPAYAKGSSAKVLHNTIVQLAQWVSLDEVESRILEFAVALSMDSPLADAAELLGDLNTAKLFYSLATLLEYSESAFATKLESYQNGPPCRSWTCGLLLRRESLYPTELRAERENVAFLA